MTVRFRVLGEIRAEVHGVPLDLGTARQRAVLVALLMDVNRAVSSDQIIDRVWGLDAPRTAATTLRSYVSRLRAAGIEIERRPSGYLLAAEEDTVDLHRFRGLVGVGQIGQALELWTGEPLAGLRSPWFEDCRNRLELEHFAALLDLHDAELRLGRHARLLGGLMSLTETHPLDERVAGQLILALYRSGRAGDALAAYRRIRGALSDELGTEPGSALRQLHERVLANDPALVDLVDVKRHVPRHLPSPPRTFHGRTHELALLRKIVDGRIALVRGCGGIGKTWLALRWAHDNIDRFPDGQLFANLRGFDPLGEPVPPSVVVRSFLDALRLAPASIPADADAQAALFRSLVADRRMLIVLDNVRDTTQVEPLLPSGSSTTVLVTSRHQLGGLTTAHGASAVTLDVLDEPDSRDLLVDHLGHDRAAAEPEAVTALLRSCGGLPLALGILAARASTQPDFSLAVLADDLADATTRLDALDAGELPANLRAVFDCSYRVLDRDTVAVLGLLGQAPGPDIGTAALAHLTALRPRRLRTILGVLQNAHLITQHLPGRFRMHDLVRLDAAERAARDLTAQRRLIDFYVWSAGDAAAALSPDRVVLDDIPVRRRDLSQSEALTWLDQEHPGVLGALTLAEQLGRHADVWRLAWSLDEYYLRTGRIADHLTAWRAGAVAADRVTGADRALARVLLGLACTRAGQHEEALDHLATALAVAEADEHLAHAYSVRAKVWESQGDESRAVEDATNALRIYRSLGRTVWQAKALNGIAWLTARLGNLSEARSLCESAHALFREHEDVEGEAESLSILAFIANRAGKHEEAVAHAEEALTLLRRTGSSYEEAVVLDRLAEAHAALGARECARRAVDQALALYRAQGRLAEAQQVQQRLV